MRFDPGQVETLVAIIDEGSFDGAARRQHLTPSAVSQRVRALEHAAGRVLVRRTAPATVTPAGEPLLRLGRQLRLLEAEARTTFEDDAVLELAVAVNADSLATWFRPVLTEVAARGDVALRLYVEDQAYSRDLLRRGEAQAAITSDPQPVQGCVVQPLGGLRYTPSAHPDLLARHRHGRGVDWSAMPMVVFNEKDHLQDDVLASRGSSRPPVVHRVPSTADFHEALCRGLGWGMAMDEQLGSSDLVPLPGVRPVVVPLYWHRWRLDSRGLDDLTADVRRAAAAGLRRAR